MEKVKVLNWLIEKLEELKQVGTCKDVEEKDLSNPLRCTLIICDNDDFRVLYNMGGKNQVTLKTTFSNQQITDEWLNTASAIKEYVNEANSILSELK